MKKLLSLVLALALVFTFAVSAFAATAFPSSNAAFDAAAEKMDQISGQTTEQVRVSVDAKDEVPVYRVSLAWESMDFEYTMGYWDTDRYIYTPGQWESDTDRTIKITNHSNRDVKFQATLVETKWNGTTVTLDNTAETTMKYVVEGQNGTPAVVDTPKVLTVEVEGDPVNQVEGAVIATISIAFTGTDNQNGQPFADENKVADWDSTDRYVYANETRTGVYSTNPTDPNA